MVQVINDSNRNKSIGSSFATGIGSALEGLVKYKVGQKQQQHQTDILKQLGVTSQEADYLSQLPPKEQLQALQMFSQGPEQPQQSMKQQGQQQHPLHALVSGNHPNSQRFQELLSKASPEQQQQILSRAQQGLGQQEQIQQPNKPPRPLTPVEKLRNFQNKKLEQTDQRELAKEQRKYAQQEKLSADKDTKAFVEETYKEGKAAKTAEMRLKRMEELINKGSLPFSALYKGFKGLSETDIGGKIPLIGGLADLVLHAAGEAGLFAQRAVTSRDTEEYEKLQADFNRSIKDIFGARISNQELTAFERMIPTLSNTDHGKRRIIRNMHDFNKAIIAKETAAKKIIAANGGRRPADLREQVDRMSAPEIDAIADDFISGIRTS